MSLSQRPRVAMVVEELRSTGGQERAALEIARALCERFEVHVVTAEVEATPGPEGFRVHRVARRRWPEALRFSSFVRAARAAIAAIRPEIVHGIGANFPGADIVHLQTVNRRKYSALPDLLPDGLLRRLLFRWYLAEVFRAERVALSNPKALFIAVSRMVGEEASFHYGIDGSRLRVIANGVDRGWFRPPSAEERARARTALGLHAHSPVVAFVGPDHRRKGLGAVLEALGRPPLQSAWLLSVGGAEASIARHRSSARALGVDARVLFLPHGSEVRTALWAADAFVFPTRYDPFGMAAAEAMACGLPCLLSARAGVCEWLGAEDALFLEEPSDVSEIARKLGQLLGDPELSLRIGRQARLRSLEFAWTGVVSAIEAVWQEALARRAHSTSIASP